MYRHPYFDLWMHEDSELAICLGMPVVGRLTIHEWPLSCVQRLNLADGCTWIYKVQSQPTVEPEFYQQARSNLLVGARVLPIPGMPAALLLQDVRAENLDAYANSCEILRHVEAILESLGHIHGSLPAFADIRGAERWLDYARDLVAELSYLVESGAFKQVDRLMVDRVAGVAQSRAVLQAVGGDTGYVHNDLCAENILVLEVGYKVLDWQRPIWGPVALDRATLLASLGIDPAEHVQPGILQLRSLLLIAWFAQAARRWFPAGAATYDAQIADLIRPLIDSQA